MGSKLGGYLGTKVCFYKVEVGTCYVRNLDITIITENTEQDKNIEIIRWVFLINYLV